MVNGVHLLLYSKDPEADRAFFRDVLKFRSVDAGHGWLIFKLPAAEAGIHPWGEDAPAVELYFMCDDLQATIRSLKEKKVQCGKIEQAPWGSRTTIRLPSGGEIGLYQPTHPTALGL